MTQSCSTMSADIAYHLPLKSNVFDSAVCLPSLNASTSMQNLCVQREAPVEPHLHRTDVKHQTVLACLTCSCCNPLSRSLPLLSSGRTCQYSKVLDCRKTSVYKEGLQCYHIYKRERSDCQTVVRSLTCSCCTPPSRPRPPPSPRPTCQCTGPGPALALLGPPRGTSLPPLPLLPWGPPCWSSRGLGHRTSWCSPGGDCQYTGTGYTPAATSLRPVGVTLSRSSRTGWSQSGAGSTHSPPPSTPSIVSSLSRTFWKTKLCTGDLPFIGLASNGGIERVFAYSGVYL